MKARKCITDKLCSSKNSCLPGNISPTSAKASTPTTDSLLQPVKHELMTKNNRIYPAIDPSQNNGRKNVTYDLSTKDS